MASRLVLSLRYRSDSELTEPEIEIEELRYLVSLAGVRGGDLVAWQVGSLAFSFPLEALPDVAELLCEPYCERMRAGLASGEVMVVTELGHAAALGAGRAVTEGTVLSAMARPGEVLIAPSVLGLAPNLLTTGIRRGTWRGRRWRGLSLYRRSPWLPTPAETIGRLNFEGWVGPERYRELSLAVGEVCAVFAGRGAGGSRCLDALVEGEPRVLRLSPAAAGEPLGALRRALSRDSSWLRGTTCAGAAPPALERLLSGAGLSPEAAQSLLRLWAIAAPPAKSAVVVLDEASRIDADTLSVVVAAAPEAFAVAARVEGKELPRALCGLRISGQIELEPFSAPQALELVQSLTKGALASRLAERWVRRGCGSPVGITESVIAAVESGELVWDGASLAATSRVAGRGGPRDAAHWIRQRLERLDGPERTLLEVVSALGGEADTQELTWLADHALGLGRSLAEVTRQLVSRRWIRRTGERILGLSSSTHREVLLLTTPCERLVRWHATIANMAASLERPLASGVAAVHSFLAGQEDHVPALAHRTALLLRANGCEETAQAFGRLGEELDPIPLQEQGLIGLSLLQASCRHGTREGSAGPPPPPPLEQPVMSPVEGGVAGASLELTAAGSARQPVSQGASLRQWLDEPSLGSEASARSVCRQLLGESLSVARVGRLEDALPLALKALAAARDSRDSRGETACLKALAALSRTAGDDAAAQVWESELSSVWATTH